MMRKSIVSLLFLLSVVVCIADDDGFSIADFDPGEATRKYDLAIAEGHALLNGRPYTGTAYERYADGSLQSVTQYRDGMRDGVHALLYPDGQKELEASYSGDMLHGRFRGWDESGQILYDLWFDHGMLKRDLMLDNRLDDLVEDDNDVIDADGKEGRED